MENSGRFRRGIRRSFPIIAGYLPISIAYGVIGIRSGIPAWVIVSMSLFIYAGAGQFMAVNLFALGVAPLEMILGIGVLNFRHFVMGLSLQSRIKSNLPDRLLLSLGMTDETFTLLSLEREIDPAYAKGIMLGAYGSWISGTVAGILFGNILPNIIASGLEIAIFALFISLLVSSLEDKGSLISIPAVSMITNSIFSRMLPSGISILLSILLGAFSGALSGGKKHV